MATSVAVWQDLMEVDAKQVRPAILYLQTVCFELPHELLTFLHEECEYTSSLGFWVRDFAKTIRGKQSHN